MVTEQEERSRTRPGVLGSISYLMLTFPLGMFWFIFTVTAISLGVSMLIIWVGVPILLFAMISWRAGARLERARTKLLVRRFIPSPYLPKPEGLMPAAKALVSDPATWRDMIYLALLFPLGILWFSLFGALWAGGLALTTLPIWFRYLPYGEAPLVQTGPNGPNVLVDSTLEALPWAVLGVVMLAVSFLLVRGAATMQSRLAFALLAPTKATMLKAETVHLQSSRARGVDAAEAERRRIERDLHDGAQQRLVAVAMGLGRARAKLDLDPNAARVLIEEAHADAKLAVAELRDLARGIYPAVLGDRGLDAALSALAAKSPVPVHVEVDATLSGPDRPPAAVESTAYFIVSETLANVAKHAGATLAAVSVSRGNGKVVLEVTDDGMGGAQLRSGGGLSGLADRAATIDGVLTVVSPVGGPTVIRADLPCTW